MTSDRKDTQFSNSDELSDVLCTECDDPIPFKRLRAVRTETCVSCAMDLEQKGRGVKKHKMYYDATVKGDEVEDVQAILVRDKYTKY